MEAYTSWLIRYVPSSPSEGARPVAVVVGRDGGDWCVRRVTQSTQGWSKTLVGRLRPHLEAINERARVSNRETGAALIARDDALTSEWMNRQAAISNGVLRIAPATPALAESAREGADFLFGALISAGFHAHRPQGRQRLVELLDDRLREELQGSDDVPLRRELKLDVGIANANVDFAVGREDQLEIAHAWSFQVRQVDDLITRIQAWTNTVSRIRRRGGQLRTADGIRLELDPATPVSVLHDQPVHDPEHRKTLEIAREVWGDAEIVIRTEEESRLLAHELVKAA